MFVSAAVSVLRERPEPTGHRSALHVLAKSRDSVPLLAIDRVAFRPSLFTKIRIIFTDASLPVVLSFSVEHCTFELAYLRGVSIILFLDSKLESSWNLLN